MPEPLIRVVDIAFVRYRTNNLDTMQKFLLDFGMQLSHRSDTKLYMRGTDPSHYIYTTELAKTPGFIGPAYLVESEQALSTLATKLAGASSVRALDDPGGGLHVTVRDPDGYQIEFVHGIAPLPHLPVREPLTLNTGPERKRTGRFQRAAPGPAHVRRLGHIILRVSDFERSLAFYEQFGFNITDSTYDPKDESRTMVAFMKCDRGREWTDHHTIGLARRTPIAIDHSAYECIDVDDVVLGGRHLEQQGYIRSWGIGRHILGSQIFDYWRDPHGFKMEHWTDGDVVNMDTPRTRVPAGDDGPGAISQWNGITEDYLKVYPHAAEIGPRSIIDKS